MAASPLSHMTPQCRLGLTCLAGFCDSATFVHMHGIFSAHVTGNFVLFAAALAQGGTSPDYLKLLTFPVFVVAVAAATVCYLQAEKTSARGLVVILAIVALLLAVCGGLGLSPHGDDLDVAITLLVVVAMGFQNTLHHFIPGAFTTVMTGTVMNWVAGRTEALVGQPADKPAVAAVRPVLLMIMFTLGCFSGALAAHAFGFAVFLAGAALAGGLCVFEYRTLTAKTASHA